MSNALGLGISQPEPSPVTCARVEPVDRTVNRQTVGAGRDFAFPSAHRVVCEHHAASKKKRGDIVRGVRGGQEGLASMRA
jgi:hypothetical protein